MTEAEKRSKRLCFTGHRPDKLKGDEAAIYTALGNAIDEAIADGFQTFITGMAWGVDIWAAEIVLERRAMNPTLHLICALPYPQFEKRMPAEWLPRYHAVLQQADLKRSICENSSKWCYQKRNEWMVDHSALLLAVYNGCSGGTRNTIQYAQKVGIQIKVIREDEL